MQRTRTKRCQLPIRTRRRQSDAKWRASVASCYETLKFIIPNGQLLPKRKASKSLILQETEKHIGTLERAICRLINVEAQDQGQGVLWRKGDNWAPATLDDVQNDFARQQREIFLQSSQGRRCYNLLQDIQEEILGLSADKRHVALLPLQPADTAKPTRDAATCTTRRHRISKARCRFEKERACQRILSAYNTGDIVTAIVPSSTTTTTTSTSFPLGQPNAMPSDPAQTVPTLPLSDSQTVGLEAGPETAGPPVSATSGVTTIRLQKMGGLFVPVTQSMLPTESRLDHSNDFLFPGLSGLNRMVVKQHKHPQQQQPDQEQHRMHEVPSFLSPHKVFGIARHDVMMCQEGAVTSLGDGSGTQHVLIKQEMEEDDDHSVPTIDNVCRKLDFGTPPHELLFEGGDTPLSKAPPCLSPGPAHVFTPIKAVTDSAGVTCKDDGLVSPGRGVGDVYMSEAALASPTPTWVFTGSLDNRVPQTGLGDLEPLTDIGDEHNLLCMETFDLDDVTDTSLIDKTPQKQAAPECSELSLHASKKKSTLQKRLQREKEAKTGGTSAEKPKCCKSLAGLYGKSGDKTVSPSPVIAGVFGGSAEWSDLDGYMLYYRQVAPEVRRHLGNGQAASLAAVVQGMWARLNTDDRRTMVTLAALENHDGDNSTGVGLSQDLEEVDVTPLAK